MVLSPTLLFRQALSQSYIPHVTLKSLKKTHVPLASFIPTLNSEEPYYLSR